jgi:hypothetical protein
MRFFDFALQRLVQGFAQNDSKTRRTKRPLTPSLSPEGRGAYRGKITIEKDKYFLYNYKFLRLDLSITRREKIDV